MPAPPGTPGRPVTLAVAPQEDDREKCGRYQTQSIDAADGLLPTERFSDTPPDQIWRLTAHHAERCGGDRRRPE